MTREMDKITCKNCGLVFEDFIRSDDENPNWQYCSYMCLRGSPVRRERLPDGTVHETTRTEKINV